MYKIAFIDELDADTRTFQRYVHKNNANLSEKFEVVPLEPTSGIDDLIEILMGLDLDAIITDFKLNEYKPDVTYSGVQLVEKFLEYRKRFPCFVLTSFDDDAVKESEDVNIIYIKSIMRGNEEKARITFLERVEEQIKHYRAKLRKDEEEFESLINKAETAELDGKEEERLLELDSILESSLSKKHKVPDRIKDKDYINSLRKLIENTDDLLNQLKAKNDED